MRHAIPGRSKALVVLFAVAPSAAHAAEGGIQIMPDWGLLAGLVVLFSLLIAPVNALLFRPLLRVLDEREQRIAGTRERARALELEAEAVLARYEDEVRRARDEAGHDRREALERSRAEEQEATNRARREAEAQIEKARREIADALRRARSELRPEAEGLARVAASRILGRDLA